MSGWTWFTLKVLYALFYLSNIVHCVKKINYAFKYSFKAIKNLPDDVKKSHALFIRDDLDKMSYT